jgi:hypothetical protein
MTDTFGDLFAELADALDSELDLFETRHSALLDRDRAELVAHPRPIPVAERPWEREGFCDVEGQCWWWDSIAQVWTYLNREQAERAGYYTYACPAAAIPLPTDTTSPTQES